MLSELRPRRFVLWARTRAATGAAAEQEALDDAAWLAGIMAEFGDGQ